MLTKFFDTIKIRYNDGIDMKIEHKNLIEQYFENKWQNDKNQAIDDPEEKAYLDQLPEQT